MLQLFVFTVSSSLLASLLVKAFSSIDSNVTTRSFLAQQIYSAIIAAVVRIRPKTAAITHIQYFLRCSPLRPRVPPSAMFA